MNNKLQLDARLSAIKDMVRPNSVVADIGCDHGYLVCALVESGIATHAFACDANSGPLGRAKKNISNYCLSNSIDTVLTNGLTDLPYSLIDTIVIAGMGGELIGEILLTHSWTRDTRFNFIFQPMTKAEKLRQLIFENGFVISKETAVVSDNKVYTVMSVSYTNCIPSFDMLTCYTGYHLGSSHLASKLYLKQVLHQIEKKSNGLISSKNTENIEKAKKYIDMADEIRKSL